jgi:hypothetical protein
MAGSIGAVRLSIGIAPIAATPALGAFVSIVGLEGTVVAWIGYCAGLGAPLIASSAVVVRRHGIRHGLDLLLVSPARKYAQSTCS